MPYLASLGVSHLYLSPILQAVAGSTHGYDVVDHAMVSTDLGGERALLSLAEKAHANGLGVVVDVVPNHMAFVAPEHTNGPLWKVLRDGMEAETAHWFDIDWPANEGRLGLPFLEGTVQEALEAGDITLGEYDGQRVLRYFDHVLPLAVGTQVVDTQGGRVAEVLARQHYRLASWRDKATVLNYRRFFDVDELIAVRVELPDVFEATHRLLLDLNHRGVIDGFRIDHPDGLADPEAYLSQLRAATCPGTVIWVEKILEGDERLPVSWDCEGTTGYDAIRAVSAALVDPQSGPVLDRTWREAGGDLDLEVTIVESKRQVVEQMLGAEVARLTRRAEGALPGHSMERLRAAVTELLVAGNVYRAYLRPGEPLTPFARQRLLDARDVAVGSRPDLEPEIDALVDLASGQHDRQHDRQHDGPDAADFAVRFQQTWGPVMAKGIEDTTFYRWHRLVALNEVGGDPALLADAGPDVLHSWAENQQRDWPRGMTALSTHDTKRSEDVRSRLLAIAGDTEAWAHCSAAFGDAADTAGVDRPTAHLLWQTLAGVGEIAPARLHSYLTKAMREARRHTAWVDGDEAYESAVLAFADRAVAPGPLRETLAAAVATNEQAIRVTVLGAKLLQLMLPGVPDVYQGCEVVDLSLVDPDNRREVDFVNLAARLARVDEGLVEDLDDEKLLVTSRALRIRRELAHCFGISGTYEPLDTSSEHAMGFVRGGRVACVVTRVPHRLRAGGGWGDATVSLPEGSWHDELTGSVFRGGDLRCADLFEAMPVTLLVSR